MAYYRVRCKTCNYYMWSCSKMLLQSSIYQHMKKHQKAQFEPIVRITKEEYIMLQRNKHNPELWNIINSKKPSDIPIPW